MVKVFATPAKAAPPAETATTPIAPAFTKRVSKTEPKKPRAGLAVGDISFLNEKCKVGDAVGYLARTAC
jgi:hypothetical protein